MGKEVPAVGLTRKKEYSIMGKKKAMGRATWWATNPVGNTPLGSHRLGDRERRACRPTASKIHTTKKREGGGKKKKEIENEAKGMIAEKVATQNIWGKKQNHEALNKGP